MFDLKVQNSEMSGLNINNRHGYEEGRSKIISILWNIDPEVFSPGWNLRVFSSLSLIYFNIANMKVQEDTMNFFSLTAFFWKSATLTGEKYLLLQNILQRTTVLK